MAWVKKTLQRYSLCSAQRLVRRQVAWAESCLFARGGPLHHCSPAIWSIRPQEVVWRQDDRQGSGREMTAELERARWSGPPSGLLSRC